MKFVDSVKIHVRSGKGGAGCTSFRREKFVEFGGPDGGDGGEGGSIRFVGDHARSTLLDLSFQQHQHAENGQPGGGRNKHGRNGKDCLVRVPLGTVVCDEENGDVLLEILEAEDEEGRMLGKSAAGSGHEAQKVVSHFLIFPETERDRVELRVSRCVEGTEELIVLVAQHLRLLLDF